MKKILIIAFLFIGLIKLFPINNMDAVNIKGLQSSGDDWIVVNKEASEFGGTLQLFHDKWLMYFLHWRPLTAERRNISVEYAKKLLLSFWGPDMPFTIKGEGGETEVGGHKAYFIDGTIYNNMIRTRFIIWNCPETNRQFIADCNINLSLGTPEKLLAIQYKITSTISCHGQKKLKSYDLLSQNFNSKKYDLSFDIPANWRSHEYTSKKWFPEGLTKTNGTLWTLLTDSRKFIDFRWENKERKISKELLVNHLKGLKDGDFTYDKKVETRYGKLEVKNIKESDNLVVGELSVVFNQQYKEENFSETYISKAFLWNNHGKTYFLLTGVVCLDEVWKRPLNLSPSEETLNNFFKNEIFPNIRPYKKK
jgi:hypothetical protein